MLGHAHSPDLHESILDGADKFVREDWPAVQRAGNRFFPRLEHLFHLPSERLVNHGIRLHKGLEQVATEVERVWRAHVFDD